MTQSLRRGTLEAIRATPAALRALLDGMPAAVTAMPGPEGWSPADVVAHLVVAGRLGALDRASRALTEDAPSFAGYDEGCELEAVRATRPAGQRAVDAPRDRARIVPCVDAPARQRGHRADRHSRGGRFRSWWPSCCTRRRTTTACTSRRSPRSCRPRSRPVAGRWPPPRPDPRGARPDRGTSAASDRQRSSPNVIRSRDSLDIL